MSREPHPRRPRGGDTEQLTLAMPTEAQQVLAAARQRRDLRDRLATPVDYDELNRMVRRQRAALTRAVKSGQTDNVVLACRDAVREWGQPAAMWPDDWTRWQRDLDDALPWHAGVDLRDL